MKKKIFKIGLDGYKIIQAPSITNIQMMSYLIVTPNNKLIVIDGGYREDAEYLTDKIKEFGSVVHMWIITHMHYDHYNALVEILEQHDLMGIKIDKLYFNFPPKEWVNNAEPHFLKYNTNFYNLLESYNKTTHIVQEGDIYSIDGILLEIIKVPNDYADYDPEYAEGSTVNDTSLVFKMTFPNGKTALFLGDLGFRAGQKLANRFKDKLRSDIVQMAHHGQNGVGEDVYKYVKPMLCMWTAPMWLYDNNLGLRDEKHENKFNSHVYKTVTVRGWMDRLNVKMHAVEGEGEAVII